MALSNRDRIHRALDALRDALTPFVERALARSLGKEWPKSLERSSQFPVPYRPDGTVNWDTQRLLRVMLDNWQSGFKQDLSTADRGFVNELIEVRNRFAHEQAFSADDTSRALDTMQRLLTSIAAKKAVETVFALREELKRTELSEQARNQTRYATLKLEGVPLAGLKPWRDVATPHKDVQSGTFRMAEFAANLGHVHAGRASAEYADGREFYARTFLTAGLRRLLLDALGRLGGKGGEPVVNLQTNFGGGKTHSMLALYHLVTAKDPAALPGMSDLMAEAGVAKLPHTGVAVLVGTEMEPAQPNRKPDGTVTRTLWGELAWQLGNTKSGAFTSGAEAYALIAESDARGTNPGRSLGQLLQLASPCLILIDEWVAYIRQLRFRDDLPAGDFGSNMTFAQALTEQIAGSPGALLVASLPQSTIEIGGDAGQEALDQLQNFFRRIHATWSPATSEEGYEIVRRRLFEPMVERDALAARAATVKAFSEYYRKERGDFPPEAAEPAYAKLMEACYPIHPSLFRTLYQVWSPLEKFQQTRGVLRLMSTVIHQLWSGEDKGLMILPASVPLDGPVATQILEYLGDGWPAVVEKDVDGGSATARQIDAGNTTLGRYSATRRVARAAFLGSAPTASVGQNPGVDERDIRLGSAQPGEVPGTFGDALRRLSDQATYLYKDGPRHWFNTQANVNRLAEERAAAYDEETVKDSLIEIVRAHVREKGRDQFAGVHACPASSADVPDDMEVRLVILGPDAAQAARNTDTPAVRAAEEILKTRGIGQRVFRNMLVFLAPDVQRLAEFRQQVRRFMAWKSIWDDRETLNLDQFQRRTAENRLEDAVRAVAAQIPECWRWLLAPKQPVATDPALSWMPTSLSGSEALAARAARKLGTEESLITSYGAQRLRRDLDDYGLWGTERHVGMQTLWTYFASYPYLPRLRDAPVLAEAVTKGLDLAGGVFGYASEVTEDGRYLDLSRSQGTARVTTRSVLLKPEIAAEIEAEQSPPVAVPAPIAGGERVVAPAGVSEGPVTFPALPVKLQPVRYFGSVVLQPDRAIRDFNTVAQEVLSHLMAQRGARVTVRVEIEAAAGSGFSDEVVRLVNENGGALKFSNNSFEADST